MFEALSDRLTDIFTGLRGKGVLTERDVDVAMREIRMALLEADVNFKVVKTFVARVKERCIGAEVMKSLTPGQQVVKIVHEELLQVLGEPARLETAPTPPTIILLAGLQGAGKTTTAAKLANTLRKAGHHPMMAALDVYRPAAIDQLIALGKQLNIPVYSEGTKAHPPKAAANAVQQARRNANDVVILDTAGRLHIDEQMMRELQEIEKTVSPHEVLLVADAMTGQDAVHAAEAFHDAVNITGLVLTKMDGDARGGAALSIRQVTGVPIKYMGVGEKTDALEVFHPDRLAQRILGMGDVMSLIERAREQIDEKEAVKLQKKMATATFNLEDFLNQMRQVRKMGPLTQLLEMIPGMGKALSDPQVKEALEGDQMKHTEAIILSMTMEERRNPDIINASRKKRIARGSGLTVQDINQLLNSFKQSQKMMKQVMGMQKSMGGRKGMRGLSGMGGMGGGMPFGL